MDKLDDFNKIISLLENNIMANLNILGRIKNSSTLQCFVDNLTSPKTSMFQDEYWFMPYAINDNLLSKMLKLYNFPNEFGFCGIPRNIFYIITDVLKDKYKLDWEEPCDLYYLPKNQQIKIEEILPSLKEEHAELVNNFYTYKHENTLDYIKKCILERPSSVIFDNKGNPISWALIREDNTMGVMYTLKEHRRKGYAKIVSKDLIHKVKNNGDIPYVHIVETNKPSIELAKQIGMISWGKVVWFGMKKI